MKNLFKYFICILFVSCSNNEGDYTDNPEHKASRSIITNETKSLYTSIKADYLKQVDRPLSTAQRSALIHKLSDKYGLNTYTNTGISLRISYEDITRQELRQLIENSDLSTAAKNSLSNFANTILMVQYQPDPELYDYLIQYQYNVLTDNQFNSYDIQVLNTTSDMAMLTTYGDDEEREDEDWDIAVGHIASWINSALESNEEAALETLIQQLK
ncbi:hypothetical protein [Zhouia amylolytica]|uniref:Uncharacterized protein n=1 Tax=Zhouia amylolytica AD3 TaxID=1286632 RepID=W2UR48_9FLAO|nr:hypothetical protein [Zhouia amylolytica]ETN95777.1 hypothetical protein P278_14990 [Zhouia amylolytica AD3]